MVDQFEIIRPLGRGGMGEVYLARDTKLGRKVALKMVNPEVLAAVGSRQQFLAEAQTTAKFSHPNIVAIYFVGEYGEAPYVALEYLEGQDLAKRMAERRPSIPEALRIALAIADALREAHRHGVLHRDLKPDNIVIGRDGRPRILDFGIAITTTDNEPPTVEPELDDEAQDPRPVDFVIGEQAARHDGHTVRIDGTAQTRPASDEIRRDSPSTAKRYVCGTPSYMAPEQWQNNLLSDKTDIWALGVLLFELCSDSLPFYHPDIIEQALLVCSNETTPRLDDHADVPAQLADLVAQCLVKIPARRPSAEQVADALRDLLYGVSKNLQLDECPFRGLRPFTERHAAMFFGREAEITAFVERIRTQAVARTASFWLRPVGTKPYVSGIAIPGPFATF